MNNKAFIALLAIFSLSIIYESQAQGLEGFNQRRADINKTGMIILGSWALGNIMINPIAGRNALGEDKYFYQMNTWWNAVNLVIAGVGYYGATSEMPGSFPLYETLQEQSKIEKILLVNAALDVGYMLGGLYLRERGKTDQKNPDRLKGFGKAIILQGAFLLTFDVIMYLIHQRHASELSGFFANLTLTPTGISYRYYF